MSATIKISDTDLVLEAIANPSKHVVVFTAPSVRAALGEEFGMPYGTRVTGKMVAALKRFNFDKVYDMNFAADLTIMEEAHEFLDRLRNGGRLPMITSCCPAWVRYCETKMPELIENLSSCKSPQQMFGSTIKSYYAQSKDISPENIAVVSVVPCTVKKSEAARPEMEIAGVRNVDIVITTKEFAKMIKDAGIDFTALPDEQFDQDLMGEYSGGGAIFGVTGGVMEAAIRTAADVLEGYDVGKVEYHAVRGIEDIKEATLELGGQTVRVAVAHGMGVAKTLLERVKNGESNYHFIEIMNCSGGCVNGPGQPIPPAQDKARMDIRKERAKALYEEDASRTYRKCHQNPDIQMIYNDFYGQPNSEKAHSILHTHYTPKSK